MPYSGPVSEIWDIPEISSNQMHINIHIISNISMAGTLRKTQSVFVFGRPNELYIIIAHLKP